MKNLILLFLLTLTAQFAAFGETQRSCNGRTDVGNLTKEDRDYYEMRCYFATPEYSTDEVIEAGLQLSLIANKEFSYIEDNCEGKNDAKMALKRLNADQAREQTRTALAALASFHPKTPKEISHQEYLLREYLGLHFANYAKSLKEFKNVCGIELL